MTLPLLRLILNKSKRSRVLVIVEDEVLLVKPWIGSGHWMLPGGGIDKGEDNDKAAARELREETGIRVAAKRLSYVGTIPFDRYGLRYENVCFWLRLSKKPKVFSEQFLEIAAFTWVSKDALPVDTSPEVAEVIRMATKEFVKSASK